MSKSILPVIAIVGDVHIAKALSEKFANSDAYFAILEEPWVSRPDAKNEITKRNNLLAFNRHDYLILAGCCKKSVDLFMSQFPQSYRKKVIVIENEATIESSITSLKKYFTNNTADKQYITLSELEGLSHNEQVAVIENSDSIGEVIAEIFCISNGYKILKIEKVTRKFAEETEELLRSWNIAEDQLVRRNAGDELFKILRSRVGRLETLELKQIVFFTNGIPYGVLPFRSPVAHFLLERDLGLQILRGFRRVNEGENGFALAMICDPSDIPDTESVEIKKIFGANNIAILDLSGASATPFRFMHLIERYPFDFVMISSHAGEVDGKRITSEITSLNGMVHEIVYDLYPSFAPVPGEDNIIVTEMIVPISIDNVLWSDKKGLRTDYKARHFNLEEFAREIKHNDKREKVARTENRKGIKFSNALQLYRLSWIPALYVVGETRYPIIFNNACSSWIMMANGFMFAEASAYIGTTKNINTTLAAHCGVKFIEFAMKGRSAVSSLFHAQVDFAKQLGYSPYLYWGHPDIELRPTRLDSAQIRKERIQAATRELWKKLAECKDEYAKKKIKSFIECILEAG